MIFQNTINVKAEWDEEAEVWVATSDDVPGLITESESAEKLMTKLKILIPELLEANGVIAKGETAEIPFHLLCERSETISCNA